MSCTIIHIFTAEPRVRTDMTSCEIRGVVCLLPVSSYSPCYLFHHCYVPTNVSSSVFDSHNHIITTSVLKMGGPSLTSLLVGYKVGLHFFVYVSISITRLLNSSFEANVY